MKIQIISRNWEFSIKLSSGKNLVAYGFIMSILPSKSSSLSHANPQLQSWASWTRKKEIVSGKTRKTREIKKMKPKSLGHYFIS